MKEEADHLLTNASSNQSGSNDFVKKLYQMLQDDKYKTVVRWTRNGDSFVVIDTNEFTRDILPKHFKHSNFASFVRQLNKYDFHKVKVSSEAKRNYEYGDDAWEFRHPEFRVNDRDALDNIKRKGPATKKASESTNGQFETPPNHLVSNLNILQENFEVLKADNSNLVHEINILNHKYKSVLEKLVMMKSFDERYYRSITILVNSLIQHGIKLPPLDFPNPEEHDKLSQPGLAPQLTPAPVPGPGPGPGPVPVRRAVPSSIPGPAPGVAPQPITATDSTHKRQFSNVQSPPFSFPQFNDTALKKSPLTSPSNPPETTANGSVITTNIPNPKFHVLLVEDDNVCIQLCRKFLVKYGCLVTVVTDGLNAISTVENNKYDLVLMDIVMPNLDGATATSVIRSFDTKTPIIAMTGNIEENDLVTYLQNGMSDILAKPFTKDDLYSILSKHLLGNEPVNSVNVMNTVSSVNSSPPNDTLLLNNEDPMLKKQRIE